MSSGKERSRLSRQRRREAEGVGFRREPDKDALIASSPPWGEISDFVHQQSVPAVADLFGPLLTYRYDARRFLEFFAQPDGPANAVLEKHSDGTVHYRIGDLPEDHRRDLNTIVQTTLTRLKNEVSYAIQYHAQDFALSKGINEYGQPHQVRKGLAGYILTTAVEDVLADICQARSENGVLQPSSTRTMGKSIRRIISRDFLRPNTLEYARSCEPEPRYRKNRHDTQNCSIIHYNAVVLNRNILQRFRELSPTAASYHWKIMLLRDLDIKRYHSLKELELDVIEHTGFNRQQWEQFHDKPFFSTVGYVWHKDRQWHHNAASFLAQLDADVLCPWLRAHLITVQELHETAFHTGNYQDWLEELRRIASSHNGQLCDISSRTDPLHQEITDQLPATLQQLLDSNPITIEAQ